MIIDTVISILREFQKQFLDMEFGMDKNLRQLHLAMKHVVKKIMPCTVNKFIGDNYIVIWITFGKQSKNWSVQGHEEFPPFLVSSVKGYSGGYIPSLDTVYCVFKEDISEFLVTISLKNNIYEIIRLKFAEPIIRDWDNKEKSLFSEIGYQPWEIKPFPENPQPCLQMSTIVGLTHEGKMRSTSYQDIVSIKTAHPDVADALP